IASHRLLHRRAGRGMGDARCAARGGAILQPVRSAFWAAPASTLERAQRPPPAGLSAVSGPALSRPALSRPTLSGAAVSGSALSGAGAAGPSGGRAIAAIASARGRRRGGRSASRPAPAARHRAARRYLAAAGRLGHLRAAVAEYHHTHLHIFPPRQNHPPPTP